MLALILAAAAAAPALLLGEPEAARPDAARVPAAPPPAAVAKEIARVAAAPAAAPYVLQPPYEIDDAVTFGPENAARTRLAGLHGPDREAVCLDKGGLPWACGLAARAALNNAIRVGPLACEPVAPSAGVQVARCANGRGDLGRQLTALGFVRPSDGSEPPEMRTAREGGVGMWNGGWRLRR